MTDISAIFERLKNNKLAIPAIAIGVVGGGYFLLKRGGASGGLTAQDLSSPDNGQSAAPGSSGGGGGQTGIPAGEPGSSDGGLAAIREQQQSFQQSLVDQFNALVQSVTGSLGQQQAQTQAALDSLSQQQAAQAQNQQQQPFLSNMPDFSSLFSALQAVPVQQGAYKSPGIIGMGGGGFNRILQPTANREPHRVSPRAFSNLTPIRPVTLMPHAVEPAHRSHVQPRATPIRPVVTVHGHAASSNRSGNRLIG